MKRLGWTMVPEDATETLDHHLIQLKMAALGYYQLVSISSSRNPLHTKELQQA